MGTMSGGLNGNVLLNSSTVHSNGLADKLYGGAGMDWFFAWKKTGEVVTHV